MMWALVVVAVFCTAGTALAWLVLYVMLTREEAYRKTQREEFIAAISELSAALPVASCGGVDENLSVQLATLTRQVNYMHAAVLRAERINDEAEGITGFGGRGMN